MGRPRTKNKDLPPGLHRDAAGLLTLKVFTEEQRARLGCWTMSFKRDLVAARIKWAEIYGFRELQTEDAAGTFAEIIKRYVEEELPKVERQKDKTMKAKYSPVTVKEYKRQIKKTILPKWGKRRFARSEAEASLGGFLRTLDFQDHVDKGIEAGIGPQANRDVSVASAVFAFGKRVGLTEYNPVLGVQRHKETPREGMPDDALFLDLYELAPPILQCWMDLGHMVGSRISDMLRIMEKDWTPGVGLNALPGKVKRGQKRHKQLFRDTPDLAEVMGRALALKRARMARRAALKGHPVVSTVYLFPNPVTAQPYSLGGFETMFRRTKERLARKRLGADAGDEAVLAFVRALDHHFHDRRARAADDAEKRGENVPNFLAHTTDQTSRRHYLGRGVTVITPNPRIKKA